MTEKIKFGGFWLNPPNFLPAKISSNKVIDLEEGEFDTVDSEREDTKKDATLNEESKFRSLKSYMI